MTPKPAKKAVSRHNTASRLACAAWSTCSEEVAGCAHVRSVHHPCAGATDLSSVSLRADRLLSCVPCATQTAGGCADCETVMNFCTAIFALCCQAQRRSESQK